MSRRAVIVLLILSGLILAALALRLWLARQPGAAEAFAGFFEPQPAEDRLVLKPARFEDLPGWREDAVEQAVPAFLRSCRRIASLPDDASLAEGYAGKAGAWKPVCAAAARLPAGDRAAARRFLEARSGPSPSTTTAALWASSLDTTSPSSTGAPGSTTDIPCPSTPVRPNW